MHIAANMESVRTGSGRWSEHRGVNGTCWHARSMPSRMAHSSGLGAYLLRYTGWQNHHQGACSPAKQAIEWCAACARTSHLITSALAGGKWLPIHGCSLHHKQADQGLVSQSLTTWDSGECHLCIEQSKCYQAACALRCSEQGEMVYD